MSAWFQGSVTIDNSIQQVRRNLENLGEYNRAVVSLMPGISSAELVEQGSDFVTIQTNEGLMRRTNISVVSQAERVVVEYDEKYQAGKKITATSHFREELTPTETGVELHLVITGVEAPGFLGFFYRKFGSSNIGKAFLKSYKSYFETSSTSGLPAD